MTGCIRSGGAVQLLTYKRGFDRTYSGRLDRGTCDHYAGGRAGTVGIQRNDGGTTNDRVMRGLIRKLGIRAAGARGRYGKADLGDDLVWLKRSCKQIHEEIIGLDRP